MKKFEDSLIRYFQFQLFLKLTYTNKNNIYKFIGYIPTIRSLFNMFENHSE